MNYNKERKYRRLVRTSEDLHEAGDLDGAISCLDAAIGVTKIGCREWPKRSAGRVGWEHKKAEARRKKRILENEKRNG